MADYTKVFEDLNVHGWTYKFKLGVFKENTKRINDTITNAELMRIHENGANFIQLRKSGDDYKVVYINIPARPVLQMTINYFNREFWQNVSSYIVNKMLTKKWKNMQIQQYLDVRIRSMIELHAKDIILSNDGRLEPNTPSTIKGKDFHMNWPLYNTGQLANSIKCVLEVIKN